MRIPTDARHAQGSFAEPFEMLDACHERVRRMLRLLGRLRAHVATHGADDQGRQAARDVMRYFDLAAPQHHLDEERHVFPALLATGDAGLVGLVRQLQQDHVAMEAGWARAREVLEALAGGEPGCLDGDGHLVLEAFTALYADHLAAEDRVAYPAARARLDAEALSAMGEDMMRRRGVR